MFRIQAGPHKYSEKVHTCTHTLGGVFTTHTHTVHIPFLVAVRTILKLYAHTQSFKLILSIRYDMFSLGVSHIGVAYGAGNSLKRMNKPQRS